MTPIQMVGSNTPLFNPTKDTPMLDAPDEVRLKVNGEYMTFSDAAPYLDKVYNRTMVPCSFCNGAIRSKGSMGSSNPYRNDHAGFENHCPENWTIPGKSQWRNQNFRWCGNHEI
jgi:hypothetical protein